MTDGTEKRKTAATIAPVTTPSLTLSMNHAGASEPTLHLREASCAETHTHTPKAKILALIKFTIALKRRSHTDTFTSYLLSAGRTQMLKN